MYAPLRFSPLTVFDSADKKSRHTSPLTRLEVVLEHREVFQERDDADDDDDDLDDLAEAGFDWEALDQPKDEDDDEEGDQDTDK
jgi:hypothetical protein